MTSPFATIMRAGFGLLVILLGANESFGQTNAPSSDKTLRHLSPVPDATSKWMSKMRVEKPVSVLVATNDPWRTTILCTLDRVNCSHGLNDYVDGRCGFGGLLMRDYLGEGSLVTVFFDLARSPKRTVISMYSTNAALADAWTRDMTKALHEEFGQDSIQENSKK